MGKEGEKIYSMGVSLGTASPMRLEFFSLSGVLSTATNNEKDLKNKIRSKCNDETISIILLHALFLPLLVGC